MTTYISWPHADDAAFRSAYESIVDETVQELPLTNGERYLVGSSVIDESGKAALQAELASVQFYDDFPEGYSGGVE